MKRISVGFFPRIVALNEYDNIVEVTLRDLIEQRDCAMEWVPMLQNSADVLTNLWLRLEEKDVDIDEVRHMLWAIAHQIKLLSRDIDATMGTNYEMAPNCPTINFSVIRRAEDLVKQSPKTKST